MQTRALQTFLAISDARSFARAADALNMTLSAVSMQMKALEEQLGVALFDRTFRPPRLTPAARQLVPHAQAVIAAEEALWASVTPGDVLSGEFHIGFINTASVRLLPGFLRRARHARPGMQFALRTGLSHELAEQVRAGRLDFAVVTGPVEPDSALMSLTIATEPLLFACNTETPSRDPARIAASTTFLQFRPEAGIGRLIAQHVARYLGPEAPRPIMLDSVDAIVECVKEGVGFTLLPEPDIRRSADARVAAFSDPKVPSTPSRDVCLIGRPEALVPAQAILELLKETMRAGSAP